MILGDGFNGIAVIIWAGGCLKKTHAKSNDGLESDATLTSLEKIASPEIGTAESVNAKLSSTGHMTAGICK